MTGLSYIIYIYIILLEIKNFWMQNNYYNFFLLYFRVQFSQIQSENQVTLR